MPATSAGLRRTWQAARWAAPNAVSSGRSVGHRSMASGQRGWKRHPVGGSIGLGISPGQRLRSRRRAGSGYGDRGHQRLGVRVPRVAEQRLGRRLSTMRPRYITAHPVADVLHHGEVVGDEQDRDAQLPLQLGEQVEDLRLHRDVEGRDGLVGDDQLGVEGERGRDAHPLALAARQLVRAPVGEPCVAGPTRSSSSPTRASRSAAVPMRRRPAARGRCGPPPARVERAVRVLEDRLHASAEALAGPCRARGDVLAVEHDATGGRASSPRMQRASVVLPEPDSPTTATISPGATARATPSRAWTHGAARPNRPRRSGKCLTSPATRAAASASDAGVGSTAIALTRSLRAPTLRRACRSSGPRRSGAGRVQPARDAWRPARRRAAARGRTRAAERAARREPAARRRIRRSGTSPPMTRSEPRAWPPSAGPPAAPACTGGAARGRARATGATSTSWPAYITPTRSQSWATTPRSWVISRIAVPRRRAGPAAGPGSAPGS